MNLAKTFKNPLVQKITAGLAVMVGIWLVISSSQKTVYLVLNGEVQEHETRALTVKGFLQNQELNLVEDDRLMPKAGSLLWGGERIFLNISSQILIEADGKSLVVRSAESNPGNVLLEAGLALYPKDRLVVDGKLTGPNATLIPGKDHQLELIRATLVNLESETGNLQFYTDGETLGDALQKAGIEVFEGDQLSYPLESPLDGSPLRVELIRAQPVQVHLTDRTITIRTTAETIGEALAGAGVALQGLDYSKPPETEAIPENNQIQIIRVREEILLKQDQIPFTSEYQAADDLELDQLQILNGGEYGLSAQRLRILYENGSEVSRELEKEWVIKEPVNRLIGYGTQITIRTADTPDGQISYWRKITAWATSYNPTCEGCATYTSSGADLKKGVIAVRLDWYRYMKGAHVYIPGYGFASVEDVGGGVPWSTNWVDLGYKEHDYVPWSQNVDVYFLAPAPSPANIMYILH
jgi:uncharacterized protein YabE (DUF348 family)